MASVYDFKPAFQRLLRPLVRVLAGAGVTANQVTLAAMALSLLAGGLVAIVQDVRILLVLPAALLLRMALNAIDGMLAREHGQKTQLGAVLNEVGDVVSDAAMYAPLAFTPWFPGAWVVALVVLAGVTELAGVMGQVVGGGRRYEGPMGKSDRAVAVGALALAIGGGVRPGVWVDVVLGIACLLLAVTVVNRARAGLRGGRAAA